MRGLATGSTINSHEDRGLAAAAVGGSGWVFVGSDLQQSACVQREPTRMEAMHVRQ
jgi:hypothetical protein